MHAQRFAVDEGADVEVVEDLDAVPPRIGIAVFTLALVVETVDLGGGKGGGGRPQGRGEQKGREDGLGLACGAQEWTTEEVEARFFHGGRFNSTCVIWRLSWLPRKRVMWAG